MRAAAAAPRAQVPMDASGVHTLSIMCLSLALADHPGSALWRWKVGVAGKEGLSL